jgi:REP element-mobilizing transposase RayT
MPPQRHALDPSRTSWHITWGTYGTRLHGSYRPTVEREHNQRGEPFVAPNRERQAALQAILNFPPVFFTAEQRTFIETELPSICERGGWAYRIAAAANDHVHILCDIVPAMHGEKVRRILKRWLGQALSAEWPLPSPKATWWAEEGSNIAVKDEKYLNNVYNYIARQGTTSVA